MDQDAGNVNGPEASLDVEGALQSHEARIEDATAGATFPNLAPDSGSTRSVSVGLNWQVVAERLDADVRILQHDGLIMVAGEYFPAAGSFFDPSSLRVRFVDIGDIALRNGYFIAEATLRNHKMRTTETAEGVQPNIRMVIPTPGTGTIIGLFADRQDAERTKNRILRGALGSGLMVEETPLGVELRVTRLQQPGRVASTIAAHGGGVIAIDGQPVTSLQSAAGPIATGRDRLDEQGDARRRGIGALGASSGPEYASSTEAGQGALGEYRRRV